MDFLPSTAMHYLQSCKETNYIVNGGTYKPKITSVDQLENRAFLLREKLRN